LSTGSGGIPNIGVGSPITIENINQIINDLNTLSQKLNILEKRLDKSVQDAVGSGANSLVYSVTQNYGARKFTITASQASLPAKAVFSGVDITAIMLNGSNLLNNGYRASIDFNTDLGSRSIDFNVKVSKDSSSTIKTPSTNDPVKWKFAIDYAIPSN
jgi:hypothetical protein